jgi:hypothetical protein
VNYGQNAREDCVFVVMEAEVKVLIQVRLAPLVRSSSCGAEQAVKVRNQQCFAFLVRSSSCGAEQAVKVRNQQCFAFLVRSSSCGAERALKVRILRRFTLLALFPGESPPPSLAAALAHFLCRFLSDFIQGW